MHTTGCKGRQGFTASSEWWCRRASSSHSPTTSIGASFSTIGGTITPMSRPPVLLPSPLFGLASLGYGSKAWFRSIMKARKLKTKSFVFLLLQSLLINGRGKFNCSLAGPTAVCNATNPECSPYVLTVVPGKTYRLRIASITSLSALNFEIEVTAALTSQRNSP
ncbi:hypothetical protein BHE74_00054098 [Ensete ventricosum]|nr:hypothetical protein BHE74_00054098 [Ensete ventricosum]